MMLNVRFIIANRESSALPQIDMYLRRLSNNSLPLLRKLLHILDESDASCAIFRVLYVASADIPCSLHPSLTRSYEATSYLVFAGTITSGTGNATRTDTGVICVRLTGPEIVQLLTKDEESNWVSSTSGLLHSQASTILT